MMTFLLLSLFVLVMSVLVGRFVRRARALDPNAARRREALRGR